MRRLAGLAATLWRTVNNAVGRIPRRARIVIVIVVASGFCSAGLIAFAPKPDHVAAEADGVPISSMVAEFKRLSPEIRLYGRVETPNAAKLTALISAPVQSLAAREGERVNAGAVLIALDATDTRLAVERAEADLAQAQADLNVLLLAGDEDRAVLAYQEELAKQAVVKADWHRQLFAQGSISRQTLNAALSESHAQSISLVQRRGLVASFEHRRSRAQASVARAESSLAEARVNLERASVKAPFPGRVTRILVAPGELVAPGTVVAEIYDDTRLEIRVPIPNVHLPEVEAALALGERPAVRADFGDTEGAGHLERLAGAVEKGRSGVDGLVRLAADVDPPDLGRAVELRMTMRPIADLVAVPVQAVYGQRRAFLVEDGVLVGIDVERVGEMTTAQGDFRLLVRGPRLHDGSRVLTTQLSNAVTGLRVSVRDDVDEEVAEEPPSPGLAAT